MPNFQNYSQQAGYVWYYKKWSPVTAAGVQVVGTNEVISMPLQSHTLYVGGYNAGESAAVDPASWAVELQVSIDNIIWNTILAHSTADGNGKPVYVSSLLSNLFYIRANVLELTLSPADHINIHWIGVTK